MTRPDVHLNGPRPSGRARGAAGRVLWVVFLAVGLTGCGPMATAGPGCTVAVGPSVFPKALRESSGVAVSLDHPGVFWTHDDSHALLFAVDEHGSVLSRHPVAADIRDWEDLSLAMCPDGGSCLYLADTGDNYERFDFVRILRTREPDPTNSDTVRVDVFPVRIPGGAQDIEALMVLPGEKAYLVSKGRNAPITVFRYPGELRPDTVLLEEVQRLTDGPRFLNRQVTGAAVSPENGLVAIRTYQSLTFYRFGPSGLTPIENGVVNLRPLQEPQGEGVGIGLGGLVALTSEGGPVGAPGSISLLRCKFGGKP